MVPSPRLTTLVQPSAAGALAGSTAAPFVAVPFAAAPLGVTAAPLVAAAVLAVVSTTGSLAATGWAWRCPVVPCAGPAIDPGGVPGGRDS
jgi:hypothetical protein